MKTQRSALLGLALGLAAFGAGCKDTTTLEIPPTPPPPIVVTVTPQNLTLSIGESAILAASVTGGAATDAKTVTWSTSNASVVSVDGTGKVTGVAEGTATVTATSTADTNSKSAAAITVTAGPAAPSVSIKSITTFATNVPVALNNVFGQIDITLNLDVPAGAKISALRTYITNGTSQQQVCEQTFSGGAEIGATEEINGASEIICSVNTAMYTFATTGPGADAAATVTFANGPGYKVRVDIVDPQGTTTAQITSADMIFNNPSFIVAALKAPTNCTTGALNSGATFWCEGNITADFLPVIFSKNANDAIASITLTANGAKTVTDAASPWSATLQKASTPSASSVGAFEGPVVLTVTSTTVGGQTGPVCINPDPVLNPVGATGCAGPNATLWVLGTGFVDPTSQTPYRLPATAFLLDNVAPAVTWFDLSPDSIRGISCNPNWPGTPTPGACYVSEGFNFATSMKIDTAGSGSANFFVMADAGVGSPTVTFKAGPAGSLVDVATGGDLAESVTAGAYLAQATTMDKLSNTRTVYAAPSGGAQTSATGAQTFGVDTTAPSPGPTTGVANNSTNPAAAPPAWTVGPPIDTAPLGAGPAGFLPNPFRVIVERHLPAGVTCFKPDDAYAGNTTACVTSGGAPIYQADNGIVDVPTGLVAPAAPGTEGYWHMIIHAVDAAWPGNESADSSRLTLNDVTPPVVGGISGPSSLVGGQQATFTSGLADNVDLGRLSPFLRYVGGYAFQWPVVTLGAYGYADGLAAAATGTFNIPNFVRSIELTTGAGRANGTPASADLVAFDVTDVAANLTTSTLGIVPAVLFGAGGTLPALGTAATGVAPVDSATFNPVNAAHGNFVMQAPSNTQVCQGTATACGSTPPASTVLSVTMTGPNATFGNPFTAVQFYYQDPVNTRWYLVGTGSPSASDNTVTSTRTWTYSVTWTVTGLKDSAGNPLVNPAVPLVAVGITSSGSAIISTGTPMTIDITAT